MPGLKVVALISGGKDSFFSILHCHANGHEVVALANLHPAAQNGERSEDIDSYMYQTIGHSIVPLYEQALRLPLYRQEILGGVVDSNKSYASPAVAQQSQQDETESLVPLLRKVMAAHPEVNAVSTGAILSDYQRTRVESVAIRLGLVPLSYLWQYPFLPPYTETSLLDDMAAAGQDARIIKVASGGLDDGFLWENVANYRTKTRLVRAMERFGIIGDGAALGEGGEFETLAIDGPWPLWKNSIQVEDDDRTVAAGEAGAASVKIKTARLVPKEPSSDFSYEQLRRPTTLDDKFAALTTRMDEKIEGTSKTSDEAA
ncbi:adenine nucleotide alpha hydrolases-like protein, partial [Aureobasidium melanogenum]